jgi:hypothetical protein
MSPAKNDRVTLSLVCNSRLTLLLLTTLCSAMISPRAQASDITVGSPISGTRISAPVLVRAHNIGCKGARPSSFGYSMDDDRAILSGRTDFDIDILGQNLSPGIHTIHFKSSTEKGACPEVSTTFTVAEPDEPKTAPSIPSNAISSGNLDGTTNWIEMHDAGTPGEAVGTTLYPATTPVYDEARLFSMTYSERAGERWSNSFAIDTKSTHFALDLYVFLPDPSQIENLELDLNQVTKDGETLIMSTQCSGNKGVWEYGVGGIGNSHWETTKIKCKPASWAPNVWHHIQIGEHHDSKGVITHDWVTVDGVYTPFVGATKAHGKKLGWKKGDVNTQFQIEGSSKTSSTATIYAHDLTVYRW